MYKVFTVRRIDEIGDDEYFNCVVIAKDRAEAINLANSNYYHDIGDFQISTDDFKFVRKKLTETDLEIREIELNESKPILGAFNGVSSIL